jgi:hypothetical protein
VTEPGDRIVYMGLPGVVLEVSDARGNGLYARTRLDNGTTDWFRADLLEPEDGQAEEKTPGMWLDRTGFPWLEAGEPGSGVVFCYDRPARRRMAEAWRTRPLEDADAEFGPLTAMVPAGQDGDGDGEGRVMFLYGGGQSIELAADWSEANGYDLTAVPFTEALHGFSVALLSFGVLPLTNGDRIYGAFVAVRRMSR